MTNKAKCKKCGHWCCKIGIHTLAPQAHEYEREYYRARSIHWNMDDYGNMICYLNQPCPHVSAKGCKIYGDHPDVCKRFPAAWNEYMEDYCELMRDKYND